MHRACNVDETLVCLHVTIMSIDKGCIHASTASSIPWWSNCWDIRLSIVLGPGIIPAMKPYCGKGPCALQDFVTVPALKAILIFKHIVSDLVAT